MQDRKLFVNVPRFIVELEELGYANLKSNDFKSGDMKSDDIIELVKEMRLISDEITESRIQEEMISVDFNTDTSKPKIEQQNFSVKSDEQNLKSPEITNSNVKSDDFTHYSREIIAAKNEVIDTLKGSLHSKEDDVAQLREVISDLTSQLKTTTQQNAWLTNLLVAPKTQPEPVRTTKATEINDYFSDISDEITDEADTTAEANEHQDTAQDAHAHEDQTQDFSSDEQVQPAM